MTHLLHFLNAGQTANAYTFIHTQQGFSDDNQTARLWIGSNVAAWFPASQSRVEYGQLWGSCTWPGNIIGNGDLDNA